MAWFMIVALSQVNSGPFGLALNEHDTFSASISPAMAYFESCARYGTDNASVPSIMPLLWDDLAQADAIDGVALGEDPDEDE